MRPGTASQSPLPAPIGDERRLIEAAIDGNDTALGGLLSQGVNINVRDEDGMTALHHAAATGARACLRLLMASGECDYQIRDIYGRTASELAIEWARDYAVGQLLSRYEIRQNKARESAQPKLRD